MARAGAGSLSERLLSPQEAADLLGVPRSWVYEKVRLGHLPHVRLGRYVRFERCTLEAWLSCQRVEGRP